MKPSLLHMLTVRNNTHWGTDVVTQSSCQPETPPTLEVTTNVTTNEERCPKYILPCVVVALGCHTQIIALPYIWR